MRYGPRSDLDQPRGTRLNAVVRAARAYADLSQPELATAMGVSRSTLARLEGSPPAAEPTFEQMVRISDLCGVPAWFFERGFEGVEEFDDQRQSVGQLAAQLREERAAREAQVADLERRLTAVSDMAGQLVAALREAEGAPSSSKGEQGSGSQEPPDRFSGSGARITRGDHAREAEDA